MGESGLLAVAWFIITFVVGAVMWAAQIGPKAAASNLSDWVIWLGLNPPNWLRSPNADLIVRKLGPLVLAVLIVAGAWIFFSIEAAAILLV